MRLTDKTMGSIKFTGELVLPKAEAVSLPKATPTKVYAIFKLLTYGHPNENKDGFRIEDVGDAWKTIIGSGINFAHTDFPLGAVINASNSEEGITCIGALQRRQLRALSIKPETMPETCTCSMEVRFNWDECVYQVGDKLYDAQQADYLGISWDPVRYDCRWIKPVEFDACALCIKGSEADHGAVYEAVSAMASEEAKLAQTERASKYGVEVLPDGNIAKPAEYRGIPDDCFADATNYFLPLDTAEHVREAMSYWAEATNRSRYREQSQSIIAKRINEAVAKFGIQGASATQTSAKDKDGGATTTVNEELEKFKNEELPKLLAAAKDEAKADALKDFDAKIEAAKVAAVEEYKQAQAKVEARYKELDLILPFEESEKAQAMEELAKADDVAFANMKADRALKALAAAKEASKATATASAKPAPITPRAVEGSEEVADIWGKAE